MKADKEKVLTDQRLIFDTTTRLNRDPLEKVFNDYVASSLNSFVALAHGRAVDAGWHKKETEIGTDIALIHSELSEALEGVRRDIMDDHLPHRKMFEVELADAAIRIFDLAGKCGLDLGGAFAEKLEYNLNRADHKLENRQKEGGKSF